MDFQRSESFINIYHFINQFKAIKYLHLNIPKIKLLCKKENKIKEIDANRNIIGKFLSLSIKTNRLINFEEALKYPLHTVPLCLAHPDGSMRKTSKSKLVDCIICDINI